MWRLKMVEFSDCVQEHISEGCKVKGKQDRERKRKQIGFYKNPY